MEVLEALYLGIIQGLTEFLPISSSGHLEILSHFLGIAPEESLSFAITVHGGTVLSTIVVFRKELARLLKGFFKFELNEETKFILKIFVSMIPILIVGLTLKDELESIFGGSLLIVGCMLLVTAMLLGFTSVAKPRAKEVSFVDAFVIGIAQAFAALPGLSRSGSTISTGLLLGVKREEVAKFSFLMVLIPIIGMNCLEILQGDFAVSTEEAGVLLTGFFSSFLTGMFACRVMINLVNRGKLYWFGLYCLIAGVAVIIYSL